MQMGAVIEAAVIGMGGNIGHATGQLHRGDVVQAKFLKAGGVDQCRGALGVHPVPMGAGGGVLAGVQGLRDFSRQYSGAWHQQVDEGAFA